MKIFTDSITNIYNLPDILKSILNLNKNICSVRDLIFFDIETTGFSAKNSMCYLIGAVYFKNEQPVYTQWFADTPDSEPELLTAFFNFLNDFKYIAHFNGNQFDIPFLQERAKLLRISDKLTTKLSDCESIDIFKLVKGCNSLLQLEHYNQKALEEFMEIYREDKYNGGELIELYKKYVISKDAELLSLLLLHNHDDIYGLLKLLPLTAYCQLYTDNFTLCSCELNEAADYNGNTFKELLITASVNAPFPKQHSLQKEYCYLWLKDSTLRIRLPLFEGKLKLFYKDYKNYYYLPDEDCALHKSVASYVDKSHRRQAKAADCYTWVSGTFLPKFRETTACIKQDYADKLCYMRLDEEFMHSDAMQTDYLLSLIRHIL